MITGDRVRHARELRGWTQTYLAECVHVTQGAIARVENNELPLSQVLLEAIAFQTGFPLTFFRKPPAVDFSEGSLLFRVKANLTLQEKNRARRYAMTLFEATMQLGEKLNEIPLRLPRLKEEPVQAARMARASLGLTPDRPIGNLIRTIERSGVLVFPLPISLERGDAFSAWVEKKHKPAGEGGIHHPVIVMDVKSPSDRLRYTIAHELGHLIMHQAAEGERKQLEKQANVFAAEFLMPEVAMREELITPVTLSRLAPLKLKWGVSLQALVQRSQSLEIITQRQCTYLFTQISSQKWKINEPNSDNIISEKPRALRKMMELIYGEPLDFGRIANELATSREVLREVMVLYASRTPQNKEEASSTVVLPFQGHRNGCDRIQSN